MLCDESIRAPVLSWLSEDMLPAVQASDSPPKTLAGLAGRLKSIAILARASSLHAGLVQLFIAHQTYGNKRYKESVDQDMRRLLLQYRHYPVYLVCSWMAVQMM